MNLKVVLNYDFMIIVTRTFCNTFGEDKSISINSNFLEQPRTVGSKRN